MEGCEGREGRGLEGWGGAGRGEEGGCRGGRVEIGRKGDKEKVRVVEVLRGSGNKNSNGCTARASVGRFTDLPPDGAAARWDGER
jgi:hypothetical protein